MLEKWKKPEYEKEVKRTSAGNGQKEERKKEIKKKKAREEEARPGARIISTSNARKL